MKKILLLLIIALFLGCSDLSVDKEEALKNELPGDFKRSVYAEINGDVMASQIVLGIQDKVRELYSAGEADTERKKECGNVLLQNPSIVSEIYADFMDCPVQGWNPNKACEGKYAGNPSYTKVNASSETVTCAIGGCWSGGWEEPFTDYDWKSEGYSSIEEYCIENSCSTPVKGLLFGTVPAPSYIYYSASGEPGKINYYINAGRWDRRDVLDTLLGVICKFVLPAVSADSAGNYLRTFSYDSTLIEQHYFLIGRSEGRPYKYCEGGEEVVRDTTIALKLQHPQLGYFYDYGKYLFCLNENDYKVYVTQENK
jgi:hypothetical protein